MRIADTMVFEQTRENLNKNRSQLSGLQNQAATQKRVTKPSDDPIASARVLQTRVNLSGQEQFLKNLNYAKSFLDLTDQTLGEMSDLLMRAKDLTLSQASDAGANDQTRKVVGTEVNQLFNQAINIGNRKLGDRFIFGGYKTTTPPFSPKGEYNGDLGEMLIHIDKDSFLAMNVPGAKVFMGEGLSSDGVSHATTQQPRTVEDLEKRRQAEPKDGDSNSQVQLRGLASVESESENLTPVESNGKNVFRVLKNLEISLMANDKLGIQESIEEIDSALNQVILARSQVGSRVTSIDNTFESLQKAKVDSKGIVSQLEDADIYELVSEINKNENSLQATLSTSGKLVQKSLLDFLR